MSVVIQTMIDALGRCRLDIGASCIAAEMQPTSRFQLVINIGAVSFLLTCRYLGNPLVAHNYLSLTKSFFPHDPDMDSFMLSQLGSG